MNQPISSPLSNPALSPDTVILQLTPSDDLGGFRKYSFYFDQLNGLGGQIGLNHPADQEVLLFGQGFDCRPFGQKQFFGIDGVHA